MKKFVLCAAAAALALVLAGCGQQESEAPAADATQQEQQAPEAPAAEATAPGPVTFTDDMGNEVTVDNPQRVVACMGSFANAWELAGGTLVGVSDDALTAAGWTIQSPDVATVGDFTAVNLEAIMALNPDFVIMTSGTGGRGGDSSQIDLRDALVGAGIPVAYFEVTTFDDYERLMRTFTDITGRADLYDQNVAKVAAAIDAVVGAVPAENPPTALLLTTFSGGTRVQSSGTQTGAMLADLGVNNLADENKSLLKDFSLEAVIEMDPDFIFVIPMGNDTEAAMRNLEEATAANPAWGSLSAVQNGRYITHLILYLSKPNAQWDAAYQGLFDNLYGQKRRGMSRAMGSVLRNIVVVYATAVFLAAVTAAALMLGASSVSLPELATWLFGGDVSATARNILENVRVPRVLAALLAGAALATSGAYPGLPGQSAGESQRHRRELRCGACRAAGCLARSRGAVAHAAGGLRRGARDGAHHLRAVAGHGTQPPYRGARRHRHHHRVRRRHEHHLIVDPDAPTSARPPSSWAACPGSLCAIWRGRPPTSPWAWRRR